MSTNDALLLIGHGSARYPEAADAMRRHADLLRGERRFRQVEIGLLNGSPSVTEALTRTDASTIRIVPFFMEDGYFSRTAVPQALEHAVPALSRPLPRIVMCPPVGLHDGMAGLIGRQARLACTALGITSRSAAILVAGHGSASAPGQALALHRHASRVAATELFARVEAACLEEAPFVADALHDLRRHPVAVIGFFAGEGGHVRNDLSALIAAEQDARSAHGPGILFVGTVTDDPAMVGIIQDQAAASDSNERSNGG